MAGPVTVGGSTVIWLHSLFEADFGADGRLIGEYRYVNDRRLQCSKHHGNTMWPSRRRCRFSDDLDSSVIA